MFRTFMTAMLLAVCVSTAATTVQAGYLVNDTNAVISVQKGVRHPQTGYMTWTHTIDVLPGNSVYIPEGQWFRNDSHVRDGRVTWYLAGQVPANRRFYFFLYGNEVRIDVTRP